VTTKTRNYLLIVLALILLIAAGGSLGYRSYKSLRQARLVRQARNFLAQPNERKALLCLQRALNYDPKDIEACRLMAELAERSRSPAAGTWRSRVVELNPHSLNDRLALAQTALVLRDYGLAVRAIEGASPADRETAAYHNIAGAVDSALGKFDEAERHFQEAANLEPTNKVPQLNLAIVRLHSTNEQRTADACVKLGQIARSEPLLRCQALRELVVHAIASQQTNQALALTRELVAQPDCAFADRLLWLETLRLSQPAQFDAELKKTQQDAVTNSAAIFELTTWQMSKVGPTATLSWLRTLPAHVQTNQPVALFVAQCLTSLKDWPGLRSSLGKQNWSELEYLGHAFKACALHGEGLSAGAKGEWELALQSAASQKANQLMLLRLASQWNWQSETEELLQNIVNRYPEERWAFSALSQSLFMHGQTRSLMVLLSRQLKRFPANVETKNNLAMTALLLDARELNPHGLAREAYQEARTNSSCVSTYAFSLFLQKKYSDALKIMEELDSKQLEKPSVAGYYGIILKATGNGPKARAYLDASVKAQVLPEERKLFDSAKDGA
jgi:tetratricopeptide (TPR) repeat protein